LIKKDIKFENPFTEETVTEEHYFHISKADLVEMELEEHNNTYERDGETLTGMQAKLQRIIDSNDGTSSVVPMARRKASASSRVGRSRTISWQPRRSHSFSSSSAPSLMQPVSSSTV
jgi:hypothetical protein